MLRRSDDLNCRHDSGLLDHSLSLLISCLCILLEYGVARADDHIANLDLQMHFAYTTV